MEISKRDFLERANLALEPVEDLIRKWKLNVSAPVHGQMVEIALNTANILINAANAIGDEKIEKSENIQIKKVAPEHFILNRE